MDIVIRAVVIYLFLWVLLRCMGKRTLSELGAFEFVLLVIFGDMVEGAVVHEDSSVTGSIIAVGTMALMVLVTHSLGSRSRRFDEFFEGAPVVVLQQGEPLMDVLRHEQLSIDDLAEAAREQGHERFDEIEWAVLEADGKVSFIARPE